MKPFAIHHSKFVLPLFLVMSSCCLFSCEGDKSSNSTFDESIYTPGPGEFVRAEIQPTFVFKAEPVYPPAALTAGREGKVWIKALIDTSGDVMAAIVAKGTGAPEWGFEKSASDAALLNKFTPAIQNGKPIRIWVTFPYEFKISR